MWGAVLGAGRDIGTFVDQIGNPDLYFHGAYAQVTYFLTGENRNYNRDLGIYLGVDPVHELFLCRYSPRRLLRSRCLGGGRTLLVDRSPQSQHQRWRADRRYPGPELYLAHAPG